MTKTAIVVALIVLLFPASFMIAGEIDIVAGKPEVIELSGAVPGDDTAVSSMLVLGDGRIAGVCSGRHRAWVFAIEPVTKRVEKLATIGLPARYLADPTLAAKAGTLYLALAFDPYALQEWAKGAGLAEGKKPVPADKLTSPPISVLNLKAGELTSLQSPIPGSGTTALTVDAQRNVLYGLSVPPLFADGSHLFRIDLATGQGADLGVVSTAPTFLDHQIPCRRMALDKDGNVLLTGNGVLKRYKIAENKLETLEARIPAVPGRHVFSYIEALVQVPGGSYYGGTSDGYLFRLDPAAALIEGFGKALRQSHVVDLAVGEGVLYGAGGEEEGLPRLFAFDLKARTFTLGCTPQANGPGNFGRIGALVFAGGKLWAAEKERNGRVFVFGPAAAKPPEAPR